MKASNPKAQPSSNLGVAVFDSSDATAGITVFASREPALSTVVQASDAHVGTVPIADLESIVRSAVSSLAAYTSRAADGLTSIETYKLAQSRRLSWQEMLKATELSFRQAEDYRRTLREVELARDSMR